MLAQLWLPIVLGGVALFFASFLSWMVLQLHKRDWNKVEQEDLLMDAIRRCGLTDGTSYMFPQGCDHKEMSSPEFQKKFLAGPRGCLTVCRPFSMGRNLPITFVLFMIVTTVLAYLGTLGLPPGAAQGTVFQFFAIATFLVFVNGIVMHSVWFQVRIVGHLIEAAIFAVILGGIFAQFWPTA